MRYQKFKGCSLFTGRELLPGNHVLITQPNGTVVDIVPESEAGDDILTVEGLLCPGFVNAHCHLELSHLKSAIPEHTGLIPFLLSIPQLRRYPAETIQQAMQQAAETMYQNGIVAVGDICNTTDSLSIKQQSPIHWHNFIEAMGFTNDKAAERFAWSQAIYQQFEAALPGRNTMVPHAPYSVSQQLFGLLNEASAGKISTIHNQESEAENEWYRHKTGPLEELYQRMGIDTSFFEPSGQSSLRTILPWLNQPKRLLLVHNVATALEDLQPLPITQYPIPTNQSTIQLPNHSTNQPINQSTIHVLCPNANQYIQQVLPPVQLLRQQNCTIALGTDSLASNHQLSIWAEIQTLQKAFSDIPLAEMLQWATLNGATALGMEEGLGSFDKGKKPGVVNVEGGVELLMR